MLRRSTFIAVLSLLSVSATEPPTEMTAEFEHFYSNYSWPESWSEAREKIHSSNQAERQAAVSKLLAIVKQLKADEESGNAKWCATIFFGGEQENRARDSRKYLLLDMIKKPMMEEAVPLIRWYLFEEKLAHFQANAMLALKPIATESADATRLEIIKARPKNAWVLAMALEQGRARELSISDEMLTELATHHRHGIRSAAVKWLQERRKPVPEFNAAAAIQSPAVSGLIVQLSAMWVDQPATNTQPCHVIRMYQVNDGEVVVLEPIFVWEIQSTDKVMQFIDDHGRLHEYELSKRNQQPIKPRDFTWRTEAVDLNVTVAEIEKFRKERNLDFALSSQGGLSDQFEGQHPTLPEMLLGIWLAGTGQRELAARVLLPAFEAAASDALAVESFKHEIAVYYGQCTLGAFTHERDFVKTERMANTYITKYPNTIYSNIMEKLATELQRRQDDFKTFTLPTHDEWKALKLKLTRAQQIDFLCDRLRLLNAFQDGQPGGVSYHDKQYAEPGWQARSNDMLLVINPLSELVGLPASHRNNDPIEGLQLTLADVPILARHLKDDWSMVMYSYWRDFHPSRTMHYTRNVLADIINSLCHQEIIDPIAMKAMSPQQVDEAIANLTQWAKDHVGKPEADLHVESLERAVRENSWWYYKVDKNAQALVSLKDPRVVPLTMKVFERKHQNMHRENDLNCIMKISGAFPVDEYDEFARKMLDSQHERGRLIAACVLIAAGQEQPACERLERQITSDAYQFSLHDSVAIVELLANSQLKSAPKLLELFITSKRLDSVYDRTMADSLRSSVLVTLYNSSARKTLLRYYLGYFDDTQPGKNPFWPDKRVCDLFAHELIRGLRNEDSKLNAIAEKKGTENDKLAELKLWIADRLNEQ